MTQNTIDWISDIAGACTILGLLYVGWLVVAA